MESRDRELAHTDIGMPRLGLLRRKNHWGRCIPVYEPNQITPATLRKNTQIERVCVQAGVEEGAVCDNHALLRQKTRSCAPQN